MINKEYVGSIKFKVDKENDGYSITMYQLNTVEKDFLIKVLEHLNFERKNIKKVK